MRMSSVWMACHFLSFMSPGHAADLKEQLGAHSPNWTSTHLIAREALDDSESSFTGAFPGEAMEGERISFLVPDEPGDSIGGRYVAYSAPELAQNLCHADLCDDYEATIPKRLMRPLADSYFSVTKAAAGRSNGVAKIGLSALPGGSKTAFFEIFSPSRLAKLAGEFGMVLSEDGASFDIIEGWDVRSSDDRSQFLEASALRGSVLLPDRARV